MCFSIIIVFVQPVTKKVCQPFVIVYYNNLTIRIGSRAEAGILLLAYSAKAASLSQKYWIGDQAGSRSPVFFKMALLNRI
jgi:hypothetical protein